MVDDLLTRGYRNLCDLDVSATALAVAGERLAAEADKVDWLCGDLTTFAFARPQYDVWHDRAVFHFLTQPRTARRTRAKSRLPPSPDATSPLRRSAPKDLRNAAAWTLCVMAPMPSTSNSAPAFNW